VRGGATNRYTEDPMTVPLPADADVEVAVVVVTHNSARELPDCLAALDDAFDGVESWAVVVVDNASTDHTVAIASGFDREGCIVVELGRNAGYAAAINAGARLFPTSRHVLALNPDIRLEPGSVRALIAAAARPGVGIAVPKLVDEHGALQLSQRREPTVARAFLEAILGGRRASRAGRWGEVVGEAGQYEVERPTAWATGAAMMLNRRCLDVVGPWDESFFLYSEETDFCLRAREHGLLTWYTPAARACHLGGESNTSPRLWSILTLNRVRAFRKRHGVATSWLFWCAVVLNESLRAARGSQTHRAALRALLRDAEPVPDDTAPTAPPSPTPWVCFSAQDWWYHNRAHSDFQLMRRVARDRPVLFVNSIGMRMPMPGRSTGVAKRIARKTASVLRFLRHPLSDTPRFHVMTPVIVPFYGSPLFRAVNARLVRAQVRLAARRLGIDLPRSVLFVTIPTAWDVVRPMRRESLLVNRSDLHSAFEETDQELIRRLEQELLVHGDVVLYTSRSLMEAEHELSGERAVFLDHGVDLDRFEHASRPEPPDLAQISRPRVGFFGGIDDYTVDVALLAKVARDLPTAQLVLIGDATHPIDGLTSMPNVHWLGFRPYEEIPSYGAGFDVALMPWLSNEWIEHSNPIKLKEYLALGLPVVSTDFPEVRHYSDVVAIAHDDDEFVALVGEAIAGRPVGSAASRRARVAGASWDARAETLVALGERERR
jgi:GT2 family glycosyltransferase